MPYTNRGTENLTVY